MKDSSFKVLGARYTGSTNESVYYDVKVLKNGKEKYVNLKFFKRKYDLRLPNWQVFQSINLTYEEEELIANTVRNNLPKESYKEGKIIYNKTEE